MKKKSRQPASMRKEYDFTQGVRGKYARRYAQGTNIVLLDPDLHRLFRTSRAVNQALRAFAKTRRLSGGNQPAEAPARRP